MVNVEIKNGIVFYETIEEKVIELSRRMGMEERVVYSSFNHDSVIRLKKREPFAQVGFLYQDGYLDMPGYALKHGVEALHPALYNLQYPGFIENCKEKNIKVRVWRVNEREYMKKLCEYGIDGVITNYPDVARKVVEEYERRVINGIK